MNRMSVQEMSSYLQSRHAFPKMRHIQSESEPLHCSWDSSSRAAIVILWGLLVYPQLDPDLKGSTRTYPVSVDRLVHLFQDYFGDREECLAILERLRKHDYIRMAGKDQVVPGTGLLASVDAAKMYKFFRTSVLARQIFRFVSARD